MLYPLSYGGGGWRFPGRELYCKLVARKLLACFVDELAAEALRGGSARG